MVKNNPALRCLLSSPSFAEPAAQGQRCVGLSQGTTARPGKRSDVPKTGSAGSEFELLLQVESPSLFPGPGPFAGAETTPPTGANSLSKPGAG